eukprot:gb/GECH01013181.1/.p1 GENE.gb/GECH01013181.1/~~gb/GECH01013181.1/.p1  ORF type:complete len:190 (+),score=85.91 gb/GECH01013181.1/:1-570(+)
MSSYWGRGPRPSKTSAVTEEPVLFPNRELVPPNELDFQEHYLVDQERKMLQRFKQSPFYLSTSKDDPFDFLVQSNTEKKDIKEVIHTNPEYFPKELLQDKRQKRKRKISKDTNRSLDKIMDQEKKGANSGKKEEETEKDEEEEGGGPSMEEDEEMDDEGDYLGTGVDDDEDYLEGEEEEGGGDEGPVFG